MRFSVAGILTGIFKQENKSEMDMGTEFSSGFADNDVQHWSKRTLVV